jgi:hypothetical protein
LQSQPGRGILKNTRLGVPSYWCDGVRGGKWCGSRQHALSVATWNFNLFYGMCAVGELAAQQQRVQSAGPFVEMPNVVGLADSFKDGGNQGYSEEPVHNPVVALVRLRVFAGICVCSFWSLSLFRFV